MLDLNITMLFQLANFLITLFVLNLLLIRPIRKIIRDRKALMDNLSGEAESFETKAKDRLENYEAELTKARQDATAARESGRQAGQKEQQALVEAAQKEAQGILGEARKSLTPKRSLLLPNCVRRLGNSPSSSPPAYLTDRSVAMWSQPHNRRWEALRKGSVYKAIAGLMVPALLVTIICAAPALASEGGNEAPRWGDFAWRVVNLIIFVWLLWHFTGKLCVNFFSGRKKKIKEGIDNLTDRRKAAEAHLSEIEAHIANLDAERTAILEESKQQAEALKQEIIAKAHEQAKQIVEMAKVAAESEGQNMIQQLRETIANELIEETRTKLLSSLNKSEQKKLINNSLKKVVLQ